MEGDYEGPSCGFAFYGPPARCTCGTCSVCPDCHGTGGEADYVGLEMKCVEVECSRCHGTGKKD